VTGSVHEEEEVDVDVVAVVVVQAIAVLAALEPHEAMPNMRVGNARQKRSLTAHRSASPGFNPEDTAILWRNLDPAPQNRKLYLNPSGRKATSTNPLFRQITQGGAFR